MLDSFKKMYLKKSCAVSGFSKKFLLTIALVYSLFIVASSVIIYLTFSVSEKKTGQILYTENIKYQSRILNLIVENQENIPESPEGLMEILRKNYKGKEGVLSLIIFKKTDDDNYFRVIDILKLYGLFDPKISRGQNVTVKKGVEILKNGFSYSTYDRQIYTDGIVKWQNIYQPVTIGKQKFLINGLISVVEQEKIIKSIDSRNSLYRTILFIISALIMLGVIVSTCLFYQNYSGILKGLASHFDQAAQGNFNVRIKQTDDIDFNRLADSFNSFVDSLMDKKTITMGSEDYLAYINSRSNQLFQEGVSLIKENAFEDALESFRVLEILKPDSHAVVFNLGVIYAKMKRYMEAMVMFERAIKIDPDHELSLRYKEKVVKLLNRQ